MPAWFGSVCCGQTGNGRWVDVSEGGRQGHPQLGVISLGRKNESAKLHEVVTNISSEASYGLGAITYRIRVHLARVQDLVRDGHQYGSEVRQRSQ